MMGVVDMVMVSPAGEHAVSGISLIDTINFLLITAFMSLATGGSVVTSQYIGRGDRQNINSSAKQLIYISVFISMIIMILTIVIRRPMLNLIFGKIDNDVMHSSQVYLLITAMSYPFLALYSSASAMFRCMGNSKITMWTALLINIVNIGGNAFFIYVLNMDVEGVALSTLIGRGIAAFFLMRLLMRNKKGIISLKEITKITIDTAMIKRILRIGIPSGLEASMFQIGKILITRIFTEFGTVAIAANAVTSTINSLAFMPGSGFGMGLLIIAGQCIGAANYNEAKRYTKKILIMSWFTYLIINLNIIIFMKQIISFFNLSAQAHDMCVTFLWIHCVTSTLFWCMSFVLPNALKAAGDARYVMAVAAGTMWLVRVCSAFLMAFPLGMGPAAVWVAMGADFLFRGIFFAIRWKNGHWMKKRVI
jgi:putative MATE family efflux protein